MRSLLIRTISLTVALFVIGETLKLSSWRHNVHDAYVWILVYYFVSSILIGWMLDIAVKEKDKFVILALGSTVLRLLVTIFGMITAVIAGVDGVELFIINFFVLYLLYLVFELIFVLSNLRPNYTKL